MDRLLEEIGVDLEPECRPGAAAAQEDPLDLQPMQPTASSRIWRVPQAVAS